MNRIVGMSAIVCLTLLLTGGASAFAADVPWPEDYASKLAERQDALAKKVSTSTAETLVTACEKPKMSNDGWLGSVFDAILRFVVATTDIISFDSEHKPGCLLIVR